MALTSSAEQFPPHGWIIIRVYGLRTVYTSLEEVKPGLSTHTSDLSTFPRSPRLSRRYRMLDASKLQNGRREIHDCPESTQNCTTLQLLTEARIPQQERYSNTSLYLIEMCKIMSTGAALWVEVSQESFMSQFKLMLTGTIHLVHSVRRRCRLRPSRSIPDEP